MSDKKNINELSNKTLASYLSKAGKDMAHRNAEREKRKATNSHVDDAMYKIHGMSSAYTDDNIKNKARDFRAALKDHDWKDADEVRQKNYKRHKGMERAELTLGGESPVARRSRLDAEKAERQKAEKAWRAEEAKRKARAEARKAKKKLNKEETHITNSINELTGKGKLKALASKISRERSRHWSNYNKAIARHDDPDHESAAKWGEPINYLDDKNDQAQRLLYFARKAAEAKRKLNKEETHMTQHVKEAAPDGEQTQDDAVDPRDAFIAAAIDSDYVTGLDAFDALVREKIFAASDDESEPDDSQESVDQ